MATSTAVPVSAAAAAAAAAAAPGDAAASLTTEAASGGGDALSMYDFPWEETDEAKRAYRAFAIERYKGKRVARMNRRKPLQTKYRARQAVADRRVRVQGRFVPKAEAKALLEAAAASAAASAAAAESGTGGGARVSAGGGEDVPEAGGGVIVTARAQPSASITTGSGGAALLKVDATSTDGSDRP
jgi:hypothetical protein